jgi:hypothetical protein
LPNAKSLVRPRLAGTLSGVPLSLEKAIYTRTMWSLGTA